MKKILGLDLGTNSIGWSVIKNDFDNKEGKIIDAGSRIIPMSQDILGKFDSGQSISQTAERTSYRGTRRLYQRDNLRRERLHRILNILGFLPEHYKNEIDFEKKLGQFRSEVKINYNKNSNGKYEFIFTDAFNEMVKEFKDKGIDENIPYDWTIYYLRQKALKDKITKEELAWVLLNFNQKRGYYQLRGDELDKDDSNKKEEYKLLTVKSVKETEDKNAKGVWYEISFEETEAIYKRQSKEPLDNWIGLKKEFIVTTSINKDGSIKYSFRAPKEDDWGLVKKRTEQELEDYINGDYANKSVGSFIYNVLLKNPTQKIRGKLIKTIERKYYKKELQAILSKQIEFHNELNIDTGLGKELYNKSINELYQYNEAHKSNISNKGFDYLFIDDIIFYQRPLKSQKSNIGGCQYEYKIYKKEIKDTVTEELKSIEVKQPYQVISKSHPLFQEFRLWQFIHNLRIHQKEKNIEGKTKIDFDITNELFTTDEDWIKIFDFLNNKKDVKQSQLIDFLAKEKYIEKADKDNYRWNYVEDKTYPMSDTRAQFLSRLKKVGGFNIDLMTQSHQINEFVTNLWHIIYSVSDKEQFIKALKTFANKNNLDVDSFVSAFEKFPPFKSDYAAYSEKAIKKLLPLMRIGKYWNENEIPTEVKNRISDIMERVNSLKLPQNPTKKQIDEAFEKYQVADDDIQRQLVKSFIEFKDKNAFTGLNTYQAGYAVYGRHSEAKDITKWQKPEDIDTYLKNFKQHSLRNPIVEQVVTETLRTVRDIWKEYGDFNEIHLELGREMKNPANIREKLSKKNTENENTNHRIKHILKELMNDGVPEVKDFSPSHQEILKIYEEGVYQSNSNITDDIDKIRKNPKPSRNDIIRYKLWLEQGYVSPYTGMIISLYQLFSTDYQIEHIIPQSRYFDNSLSNKIICESDVNEDKSNKTAFEYIKEKGGSIVHGHKLLTLEGYESHCKKYFVKNRTKLQKLLSEEIPDGFIERQMNDSRYISKLIKGLLSNIVRDDNEQSETSKHLIPITGAITSKLKQDWGLNNKWNEIVLPRFERLNKLTETNNFTYVNTEDKIVPTVPDELQKGFNKKRIDHRHHALDAIVIACCTREHTHYLNALNSEKKNYGLRDKLLIKNEQGDYTKHFQLPWNSFPVDTKNSLDNIIVSFKQNLRVINKATNYYQKWVKDENGQYKRKLVKQEGENWAIRKPMHTPLPYGKKEYDFSILKIKDNIGKRNLIVNEEIKVRLEYIFIQNNNNISETKKDLSKNLLTDESGRIIEETLFNIPEVRYRKRQPIQKLANRGKGGVKTKKDAIKYINKVSDRKIREDLLLHLEENDGDIDKAFSIEGITNFNSKRNIPIYKLPISEASTGKFPIGVKKSKNQKFGEAESGTNLYFAIYETTDKNGDEKRVFDTIPLNDVIEYQKQTAHLPKNERTPVPLDNTKGELLFTLSPNDLVYVPTDEELENINTIDFSNLNVEQKKRIYVVNDFSSAIYFTPNHLAKQIAPKEVDLNYDSKKKKLTGSYDTKTASIENTQIKDRCIKLKVNRLGRIVKVGE